MGAIAKQVLDGLGEQAVIGVIPEALKPHEISGPTLGEQRVVPDMHTRKVRAQFPSNLRTGWAGKLLTNCCKAHKILL